MYDLQQNGKLIFLKSQDDPRWTEMDDSLAVPQLPRYVHSKPSAATKRKFLYGDVIDRIPVVNTLLDSPAAKAAGVGAAVTLGPKVLRALPKAASALAATRIAVGGVALSGGVTAAIAALLAAAGLTSYFGTRYLIDHFPTKQRRLDAAADAYKTAKREAALAAGLGRDGAADLPPAVLKVLSEHYKQVREEISAYPF